MKAADDATAPVPPAGGLVIGGKDSTTGTLGRTEESGFGKGKQVGVAEGGERNGRFGPQPFGEARRVTPVPYTEKQGDITVRCLHKKGNVVCFGADGSTIGNGATPIITQGLGATLCHCWVVPRKK